MSKAATQRQRPMPATANLSDSLRQETLNMERRLLLIQKMQEQARLKFNQKRAKNQGLFWENSRPISIRKLAENILQKADKKAPLVLKNKTPMLSESHRLVSNAHPKALVSPKRSCKVTLSPITTQNEDHKEIANAGDGEFFDEAKSRRLFQEARVQWLRGRQKKSVPDEGATRSFQLLKVEAETVTTKRAACYHCYKLLLLNEAYREPITKKNFCNADCVGRYFNENRLSCQNDKCYKACFIKQAIIDSGKSFCSEQCKVLAKN